MKYLCCITSIGFCIVVLTETSHIKPVYEVVGYLIYVQKTNALPFLMNTLTNSLPQNIIARPVLNLL